MTFLFVRGLNALEAEVVFGMDWSATWPSWAH